MRVALLETGARDAHELRLGAQLLYIMSADIAHTGAQAPHHLIDRLGHGAAERHATLDAFGNELLVVLLEVTVAAAAGHRAHAAHAAVDLELPALEHLGVAGRFLAAGEHGAEHNGLCTGGKRLDDIT